ncbi:hypothetical protein GQ42DRAFT_165635 [Ramicandelaber brevisporus]|nr:hypothetical protein GQ42DRAFT_165635 [Ramicandelaber brevisporus]
MGVDNSNADYTTVPLTEDTPDSKVDSPVEPAARSTQHLPSDHVSHDILPSSDSPLADEDVATKPTKLAGRVHAVDLMRGFTIIMMIICNSQNDPLPNLSHAEWFGFTIADSIFPSFLFVVGVSIVLALNGSKLSTPRVLWKVVKRSILLFSIGLLLNGFPYHYPGLAKRWRIAGVLQRIALCYFVNAVAFVLFARGNVVTDSPIKWKRWTFRVIFPAGAALLWLALTYGVPVWMDDCGGKRGVLTEECSTEAYFDTHIFGRNRIYQKKAFDPEGSLSHVSAALNTWAGMMLGEYLVINKEQLRDAYNRLHAVLGIALTGLALGLFGALLNPVIPIGKPLWTFSYVFLSIGVTMCAFSAMMYAADIRGLLESPRRLVRAPFRAMQNVGRNSLVIYVLSEMVIATLFSIPTASESYPSAWAWMYYHIFSCWLPVELASLVWSLCGVGFLYLPLAWFLDRKQIYVRL